MNPKYKNSSLLERPFVIFDDVCTTGATAKEAARALKQEGVKKVWILAVAR